MLQKYHILASADRRAYVLSVGEPTARWISRGTWTGLEPSFANDASYVLFADIPTNVGAVMAVNIDGSGVQERTYGGGEIH